MKIQIKFIYIYSSLLYLFLSVLQNFITNLAQCVAEYHSYGQLKLPLSRDVQVLKLNSGRAAQSRPVPSDIPA
jgi:hypothetical protein